MTAVLYKVYCFRGTEKQIWFEVEDLSTGQGVAWSPSRVTAVTNRIVGTMFRRPPSEQAKVLVSGLVLVLAKSVLVLLLNALMGGQTSVRWVV